MLHTSKNACSQAEQEVFSLREQLIQAKTRWSVKEEVEKDVHEENEKHTMSDDQQSSNHQVKKKEEMKEGE